jgi:hypothetical protein
MMDKNGEPMEEECPMAKLEEQFTQDLLKILSQAEAVTGVAESRLKAAAEKDGGVKAVKNLLGRGQQTRQFGPLQAKKRLDLTVEQLVTKGRYASLFTDEEANLCLQTLLDAGAFGR